MLHTAGIFFQILYGVNDTYLVGTDAFGVTYKCCAQVVITVLIQD